MNNQDILPTASLQSFPQLSQIPSQISDVLNGEKIVASFEDSTIKYIIIFASFLPALTILLSLPIRIASFYEVFMQFIGVFFVGCGISFFFRGLGLFHPCVYTITNTRIICMSNGVINIRTLDEIYPHGIHYGQYYIHVLFQKYHQYSRGRDNILLLKIPMSREIGQYISNQVECINRKNSQVE